MNTKTRHDGRKAAACGAIIVLLALLGTAAELRAEDPVIPRFAAELDSGTVTIKEPGFGSGVRYGAGVFFRTGHRMALEVLLETYGVSIEDGAADLDAGRMDQTTLMFNQHVFLLTRGRFLPYLLGGIGFTFIGYTPTVEPLVQKDFVDRMALQLGGGFDLRLGRALAVTAKARYNMVKTWVETLPRDGPIRETDPLAQTMLHLYGLELGLGIKISF